jgi:glyoxylase-like metal-dependent hydrolase (beta-lactamase superfamily II)
MAGAATLRPSLFAQQGARPAVSPLTDKLHLLANAGGNIAILEGPGGLLLIDSGVPESIGAVLQETGNIGERRIVRLINTHWHFDHTGGNTQIGRDGAKILAHANTKRHLSEKTTIAFFQRSFDPLPPEGLPAETFSSEGSLKHGGETVHYRYLPPAHTDGDTVIHFQNANVFHGGDLLFNGFYPFIDYSTGGSLAGMAANAERIGTLIDAKTKVIPGHGSVMDRAGVKEFHDMLAGSLEIMQKIVKDGKTLEQAQAMRPFEKYDGKWGQGFLKSEQWLALNYAGMTARKG